MNALKLFVVFSALIALIGLAMGEISERSAYKYNMNQSIEGNGFFSSYQDIASNNLLLRNHDHGSGMYKEGSLTRVRNTVKEDWMEDDSSSSDEQSINYSKSTDYAYAATRFNFARSFKVAALQSKGQQETCIKNYANDGPMEGISMKASFSQLDALSSDLSASLYFLDTEDTDYDLVEMITHETTGSTKMDLNSVFTGKGHIGVLDLNASLIDEDYLGTYTITKKMSKVFRYYWEQNVDQWLPCCTGGFADLNPSDMRPLKSAKGVFDCTCVKTPTKAQFPRVY